MSEDDIQCQETASILSFAMGVSYMAEEGFYLIYNKNFHRVKSKYVLL